MKQVTIEIPDKKYPFFLELVESLGLKKVGKAEKSGKEQILAGVKEAVEEMKLIKAGKKKARNAEDFLNEL
ncbi:MAG TPA: hypothetical protein VK563_10845 [Puia sp.]|nr:hypothetical protein [Puia sp.]